MMPTILLPAPSDFQNFPRPRCVSTGGGRGGLFDSATSGHEMFFFSFFSFLSYLTPESNLCPVTLYSWLLLFEIFVSHERVQNCPN